MNSNQSEFFETPGAGAHRAPSSQGIPAVSISGLSQRPMNVSSQAGFFSGAANLKAIRK